MGINSSTVELDDEGPTLTEIASQMEAAAMSVIKLAQEVQRKAERLTNDRDERDARNAASAAASRPERDER